jgi:hypothetical protein
MAFGDIRKRIEIQVELTTQAAKKGLGDFRREVGAAEGVLGKMRAGVRSAGSALAALPFPVVATAAAGATAAVGKFVADAANKFKDLALEVDAFSRATGTSLDEASRLVEVSGDLGVEASVVERAMGRMNRSIEDTPEAFDRLGAGIERAADGSVDASDTFRNVIVRLGQIKDPALQAAAAQQTLGRSWQDLAPLISQVNGEVATYDELLGSVEGKKIIDERDVESARKLRDAQDRLGDAIEEDHPYRRREVRPCSSGGNRNRRTARRGVERSVRAGPLRLGDRRRDQRVHRRVDRGEDRARRHSGSRRRGRSVLR